MFADLLIEMGQQALITLINMFPSADQAIVATITTFSSQMYGYLQDISFFIPVNTLIRYIGYILVIESLILFVKILKWIFATIIIRFAVKFIPRLF